MKPLRLYIDNFICHDKSYIDFTQFNSAQIIGKVSNNDLFSNGVGKTSIFKAIEYVLFNQADNNLERIIRDDTQSCCVTFDFVVDSVEYRVSRTRTKKGATDLTLYKKAPLTANVGSFHTKHVSLDNVFIPINDNIYWADISGRRALDTEKDLFKLIKLNIKSFRNTIHFLQNSFEGLATATPEKRKLLLKEVLDLIIYSKLEKKTKDKGNLLSKEIEKNIVRIEELGNPDNELVLLYSSLNDKNTLLSELNLKLSNLNENLNLKNSDLNSLKMLYPSLENKFTYLLDKEKSLSLEKNRLEISIKEYKSKKSNIIKASSILIDSVKVLKEKQLNLISIDFSQESIILEKISSQKQQLTHNQITIKNSMNEFEELNIPLPNDKLCHSCRQEISEDHKKDCIDKINLKKQKLLEVISDLKSENEKLLKEISISEFSFNSLISSKKNLEDTNFSISSHNKDIKDKNSLFKEYDLLLKKFNNELDLKLSEIDINNKLIKEFSESDSSKINLSIDLLIKDIDLLKEQHAVLTKELLELNNNIAVIQNNIEQKEKLKVKLNELIALNKDLYEKYSIYPLVIQAYSAIPKLIIQNILDELQFEANKLLAQLKPGLQLSFFIEKIKGDGTEADTLDINYFINGKERYYEQLSGAMKLAVNFSLKLGLSFLLQKKFETKIEFLLLDEIDQALDKASVDAFSDIVKFFQKDFTILIITHNDRLKDKFSHAILVEQDINMVSHATVVSSW